MAAHRYKWPVCTPVPGDDQSYPPPDISNILGGGGGGGGFKSGGDGSNGGGCGECVGHSDGGDDVSGVDCIFFS